MYTTPAEEIPTVSCLRLELALSTPTTTRSSLSSATRLRFIGPMMNDNRKLPLYHIALADREEGEER